MCDFISWGVMRKSVNGFNKNTILFLDDEQMKHLMDYGDEQYDRSFGPDDVQGHYALATFYRIPQDSFKHREGLCDLPKKIVKALKEGRLNKAKARYEQDSGTKLLLKGNRLVDPFNFEFNLKGTLAYTPNAENINSFLSLLQAKGIRWASNDTLLNPDGTPTLMYWKNQPNHGFRIELKGSRFALVNSFNDDPERCKTEDEFFDRLNSEMERFERKQQAYLASL